MFAVVFPPQPPITPNDWNAYAVHAGIGVLAFVCFSMYLWRMMQKPDKWEPAFWIGAVITATWLGAVYDPPSQTWRQLDWVTFLACIVWLFGFSGLLMWVIQQAPAMRSMAGFVILPVCLFGIYCYDAMSGMGDVNRARRRTDCANRLRQSTLAIHNYHDSHKRLPLAHRADPNDQDSPSVSWRVQILPWMEYASVYDQYDQQREWDDRANLAISRTKIDIYSCPENWNKKDDQGRYYSDYYALTGEGALFDGTVRKLSDIPDGTSKTIMLVEAAGQQIIWTDPKDIDVESAIPGVNLPGTKPGHSPGWLSSYHRTGTNVGFADGSIHSISPNISPEVLRQLMTANGGENPTNY